MAQKVDDGYLDQFEVDGLLVPLDRWPVIAESDQWDEWMKGGTWVAEKGRDFTTDTGEFADEIIRRAEAANLNWSLIQSAGVTETPGVFSYTVTFRVQALPDTVADLQAIWDDAA